MIIMINIQFKLGTSTTKQSFLATIHSCLLKNLLLARCMTHIGSLYGMANTSDSANQYHSEFIGI
jgi:hypothetical protein